MAVGTKVKERNTKRNGTIVDGESNAWLAPHLHQYHDQYVEVSWDAEQAGYYGYSGQASESVPLSSLTALPE